MSDTSENTVRLAVSWPVPQHLLAPHVRTEVVGSRMTRVYAPPRTAADYAVQDISYLEAAVRAEAAGADGYLIHSGGDYGLHLIRDTVSIPAFGCFEAAVAASAVVGPRFSIVTVWPSWTNHIYPPLFDRYRCGDRCVSVRNVVSDVQIDDEGGPSGISRALDDGRPDIVEQIATVMRRAVEEDGAESVILGCTCMSAATALLAERCPVPVIDPLAAGLGLAQTILSLGLAPRRAREHQPQVIERDRLTPLMVAACEVDATPAAECGDACDLLAAATSSATR